MRQKLCRAAFVALCLVVNACGGAQPPAEPARLRIIAEPPTARVYVDDHYAGLATLLDQQPRAFREGVHYVTIQATGFFPHDIEANLVSGVTTVRISLRRMP